MDTIQIDEQNIILRSFKIGDKENLLRYFNKLSDQSKKRFGPHPFTLEAIDEKYLDSLNYRMFVAYNAYNDEIIAYTIVKFGWVEFDTGRLQSYGLSPETKDVTIAPSVADDWQSKGLGGKFFSYVLECLKAEHEVTRLILWGGVQSDNEKAVRLYKKFNFRFLGEFEHHGMNMDMVLKLK
ncbi:MAG: GNAT family N-acetyltransferase [Chloroflexia bacterium]|nr:GNAT family N-acetyltransferase [Chloroflexia bacterium]